MKSWNVTCNCGMNVSRERGKALRVIPRGKQRLTVYRAHQVWFHWASQKCVFFDHENGNISKFNCSFDPGAIFPHSLGHDISRNAFVVSVYAFERNSNCWTDFFLTPKIFENHEISMFLGIDQEAFRLLPGCQGSDFRGRGASRLEFCGCLDWLGFRHFDTKNVEKWRNSRKNPW